MLKRAMLRVKKRKHIAVLYLLQRNYHLAEKGGEVVAGVPVIWSGWVVCTAGELRILPN